MHHAVDWFEIPVADMPRAIRFYETVTGRALRREAFGGPGEELAVFEVDDGHAVNGALLASPEAKPASQGTTVYLHAPGIDAWLARVPAAGGQVVTAKTALPDGMGWFAHILDSEGNRVGLHSDVNED